MSPISSAKVLLQRSGQCEGLATLVSMMYFYVARLSAGLVGREAAKPSAQCWSVPALRAFMNT